MNRFTNSMPPTVFKSSSEVESYLNKQVYHMNPLPTRVYVTDEMFERYYNDYNEISNMEQIIRIHFTVATVEILKYRKYYESPLWKKLNN